jgi:hypothetical protein
MREKRPWAGPKIVLPKIVWPKPNASSGRPKRASPGKPPPSKSWPGQERAAEKAREALAVRRTGVALARLCLIVELAWSEDGPDRRARPDA